MIGARKLVTGAIIISALVGIGVVHAQNQNSSHSDAGAAKDAPPVDWKLWSQRSADWNGSWRRVNAGGRTGGGGFLDPTHVHINSAYANPELDFYGPTPGNYETDIPYKPEAWKRYKKIIQDAIDGHNSDHVAVGCHPYGMPRMMTGGAAFIVTPDITFILDPVGPGANSDIRRIYTDGRKIPTGYIPAAVSTWDGYSVGKWDGDTLVIKTVHILGGDYDQTGSPESDQVSIDEKMSLDRKTGIITDVLTTTDPVMFTRPWTVKIQMKRTEPQSHWPDITGLNCGKYDSVAEDQNGQQKIILPSERPK